MTMGDISKAQKDNICVSSHSSDVLSAERARWVVSFEDHHIWCLVKSDYRVWCKRAKLRSLQTAGLPQGGMPTQEDMECWAGRVWLYGTR